ncbi:MAG TPA: ABC transporter ATP-binding protein [Anaerolineales bacterium]|jgi:ABC-2 type transport system ATP-binding protein|nr:ABC transporter ATP-binding protein [Anaerolineales bacterium]
MIQEQDVITVEGLRKSYGSVKAVDNVTFQVQRNEIFGMVGPNGSGKTTTIECIEGLRQPDEGRVSVLGLDPQRDIYELRERTGVQLQSSNLPHRMRVEEALNLFSSFYRQTVDWHPLLEEIGLPDKQRALYSQLSGGQKQRLFVALALINRPEIVFLDELTTGLDPQARHATWDLVRKIQGRGATVFITTHFMEEAERLCNRVAILDHGRIIALDTPENLVSQLGMGTRIIFQVNEQDAAAFQPARIGAVDGVRRVEQQGEEVVVYGQGDGLISAVVHALETARLPIHNLHTEQATLEDAFLALTGHAIRD